MYSLHHQSQSNKQVKIVIAAHCGKDVAAGAFIAYHGRIRLGGDLVFLENNNISIEVARLQVADRARAWARANAPGLPVRFVRAGEARRVA